MKTNHYLPLFLALLSASALGAAPSRSASTAASGSTRTVNVASADTPASRQARIDTLRSEVNALHRELLNAEQQAERRRREAEKLQVQAPAAGAESPQPVQRADTRSKIDPRIYAAGEQIAQRRRAEELRAELEALKSQIRVTQSRLEGKKRALAALEATR